MPSNPSKKILIVSLSNIGDVFLTVPVVSAVRVSYPDAELNLLVGKGAKEIFQDDPRLQGVIPYDKKAPFFEKWRLVRELRKRKFDLVVDLRQSLFPILLGASQHTTLFSQAPRHLLHKMDRHLWKLESLGIPAGNWRKDSLWVSPEATQKIEKRLMSLGLQLKEPFVLLSPGSKSYLKRWKASSYASLCSRLHQEKKLPILFVGEENDRPFVETITASLRDPFYSLVGQTSLPELIVLIRSTKLLVTNDNATLHIASLLGTPTVAIFGPTDPRKYGPRSEQSHVVRKDLFCSPCEKAHCPYHHECMEWLSPEEVYQACCNLL